MPGAQGAAAPTQRARPGSSALTVLPYGELQLHEGTGRRKKRDQIFLPDRNHRATLGRSPRCPSPPSPSRRAKPPLWSLPYRKAGVWEKSAVSLLFHGQKHAPSQGNPTQGPRTQTETAPVRWWPGGWALRAPTPRGWRWAAPSPRLLPAHPGREPSIPPPPPSPHGCLLNDSGTGAETHDLNCLIALFRALKGQGHFPASTEGKTRPCQ